MSKSVSTEIQMRFADVDMLGHVNNVNLQHYYDVGKNDYFTRILRCGVRDWGPTGVVTASTRTDYLAQTYFSERVFVETWAESVGNKSFTLRQRIVGVAAEGAAPEVKSESTSVLVAYDFDAGHSVEVPEAWRRGMTAE